MLRALGIGLVILSGVLFLATPFFLRNSPPALETEKDKESYSIGYQVGRSMQTDGVEVDFERLIQVCRMRSTRRTPV